MVQLPDRGVSIYSHQSISTLKIRMMKKITTLFGILALLSFTGCIEDGDFDVTPAPETGFALITPTITNINLNFALPDNPAFTLSWTDSPSGSGPYTVEASTEEDFSAPMTLGSSEGRTFTMSTAEFNSVVIGAGAEAFEPFMIHMRVSKGADTSETTTYSVSPYTETPPVIASPESGTAVVLSDLDPAATAITMEFEDPDFGDSNGMTVDYTLEFAAVGTDFETVFESETTNELSLALSNEALNTIALEAGLIPEEAANLEVRLKAIIESEAGVLERFSDGITLSITPYAFAYPFRDFFMVGNAVDLNGNGEVDNGDWNNNLNNPPLVRDPANANRYVYKGFFSGGSDDIGFKLLETKGQWQPQWGLSEGSLVSSTDFGGDPPSLTVPADGYYEIIVDVDNASFTATPFDASGATEYATIGIIGNATPGGWDADTDMTQSAFNPHLWFINGISLVDGEAKFRADDDWAVNWGGGKEFSSLGNDGTDNIPVTEATYDVWFNDLDGSYILIPLLEED